MSIAEVRAARVLDAAGWASEAAPSKMPGIPFGKFFVFIPIIARPMGKEHG
jgi:hypothetical protein